MVYIIYSAYWFNGLGLTFHTIFKSANGSIILVLKVSDIIILTISWQSYQALSIPNKVYGLY